MTDLQYPIGNFRMPVEVSPAQLQQAIQEIAAAPPGLRRATAGLSDSQLDTPYRPLGWTVRQVVHHVADSHVNAYVRFRLALTENEPSIKGYDQTQWAELADARTLLVEPSLAMLEALHQRWVTLLRSLAVEAFARRFHHSEMGAVRLDQYTCLYSWHGRHHTAHITGLRDRMGWS